jgi:hypothetical protein
VFSFGADVLLDQHTTKPARTLECRAICGIPDAAFNALSEIGVHGFGRDRKADHSFGDLGVLLPGRDDPLGRNRQSGRAQKRSQYAS